MVWSFGFGANLNAEHLQEKKKLKILDSCAAKVEGWYLAFPEGGISLVEPAFGSAYQREGAEIHGLAFATSKED